MEALALAGFMVCCLAVPATAAAPAAPASDDFATAGGPLRLTFIGHGSLRFDYAGKVIYIDPYGKVGDYAAMPPADLVLLTHEHQDHLDAEALAKIGGPDTPLVLTGACLAVLGRGMVLENGQTATVAGIGIEAVPAYNIKHMRAPDTPYHPKGRGNGYVLTFGDKRVYVAGDTENIPEMADLKNIDIAFLPMNLPYTMTPEMVADAARMFRPRILYPYHYGDTDPQKLVALLADSGIEVRVRALR
ncbi:MBL fold metallo-hydrolase [Solidesulfovibrio sp.]|uniref:MBL fold metallo-hydrolase n=1 Tax=Solidesulfovibrio sp. TaxID=2910990 RepID=UPI002B21E49F|nr:MBL fold metallo-hydrolase [Solidesulfovibrio sp.]MEA4856338.1 MBL fold metallo-hydrolase [Solidesulfovibrio sp.]